MLNEDRDLQPGLRAQQAKRGWPPEDNNEDDGARVLDCGAPGPAREGPALFYQGGRAGAHAWIGADHARAS